MKPVRPLCYMICGPDGAFYNILNILILLTNKNVPFIYSFTIDLFSLYVLFSWCRSCDNTQGNCFFQISSYSHAYLRIIYERTKGQVPLGPLLGKQNIQAKEVYLPTENKGASNVNCSTVVSVFDVCLLHNQSPLITMSRYTGYSPGNEVEVETEQ